MFIKIKTKTELVVAGMIKFDQDYRDNVGNFKIKFNKSVLIYVNIRRRFLISPPSAPKVEHWLMHLQYFMEFIVFLSSY